MRPISSRGPSVGSMALVKIVANSMPTSPMQKAARIRSTPSAPGTANHSAAAPIT